jgi:6-pyruvoyltetrahydropterin/6-carboxytetrahydropterin synthase
VFRSTKRFTGFSCCHRQPAHAGHCKYLHGYSRAFYFVFECTELEPETQFVMEFGGLKKVKAWLEHMFDHTCLINEDDPELQLFQEMDKNGLIQLRVLPNVSMEASAKLVAEHVQKMLDDQEGGRVSIHAVECRENEKNSAWYYPGDTAGGEVQAT